MGKQSTPKKGITPPKGRPTRPRDAHFGDRRVFGPLAQWFAVVLLLVLVFALLIMLTGGGDFNPLNDQTGAGIGQLVSGAASHLM